MALEFPGFYPLPADYGSLTNEGKRKARVAACSLRGSPDEFAAAWNFFRRYYLLGEGSFYKAWRESPPAHTEIIRDVAAHRRNIQVHPRGSGKSTVGGTELPLLLVLTRPHFTITLSLATDHLVELRIDRIRTEIAENRLIVSDFGKLKTTRGEGLWSLHALRLRNRSLINAYSVESKKRGDRPDLFILDDPEFDANRQRQTELTEAFDQMLFKVIIPMLDEGSGCLWMGTIFNRQAYIYRALSGSDPRFTKFWNRRLYRAEEHDPKTGSIAYYWPWYWGADWCARKREEIGPSAFASEYNNAPASEEDRILRMDETTCGYVIEGDPLLSSAPLHADEARVRYTHIDPRTGSREARFTPLPELAGRMVRAMMVDYAETQRLTSDWSVIHILGIDRQNTLWSWELWHGRVTDAVLLHHIFRLGELWRPSIFACEKPTITVQVAERVRIVPPGHGWSPRITRLTYPRGAEKGLRMGSLEWRFNTGRIKLPVHRRSDPCYKLLFDQIECYTPDLAMLDHDDHLDTLAMLQYVLHPLGAPPGSHPPQQRPKVSGENPETGLPTLSGLNASELTPFDIDEALAAADQERYNALQMEELEDAEPRPHRCLSEL